MSRLQEQTNDWTIVHLHHKKKGWMSKRKKLERGELGLCVHSQHNGDNDKDKLFFPPTRKMQMETKTRKVPQELEKTY